MGKTWRRERYESDENSSRSFAKNQKRQWIDLEIMEEAADFEHDLFDQLGNKDEEMKYPPKPVDLVYSRISKDSLPIK